MSKKDKRSRDKEPRESILSDVSRDTWNAVYGILSVIATITLLLAAFKKGGPVGDAVYSILSDLFGLGYYIVALAFLILSISFFKAKERKFAWIQIIGATVFFVSALGLTSIIFPDSGGLLGGFISKPLLSLFDTALSIIITSALIIISLLVTFDTSIKLDISALLNKLFRRKKEESAELAQNESDKVAAAVEMLETTEAKKDTEIKTNDWQNKKKDIDLEGFVPLFARKTNKAWNPPPLSILDGDRGKPGVGDIKANANIIKRTLANFGIIVEMDEISIGPSVTRYALKPAEGVKLSKILGLQNNLELALAAHPVRIEAPIPGKSLVGIEVPNTSKATVGLGSLLAEKGFTSSEKPLLVALGRDISGNSHFANISKMPHCLVAGATGSGKSVTIHTFITSLLYRNPPENLKFIMVDPKRVELTLYNKIPHLLTPVITDAKKSILALKWATKEMERRYDILEKAAVRDIESYHKHEGEEPMPYILIIIDELADLMQAYPRELEAAIVRLAQMSRAVGIHLILSTQRPSVNVITGLIKANIPCRVALQVSSQIDSRTILDAAGAEKLLGAGDMLYLSGDMAKPTRIQSAFITESEVKKVSKYLAEEYAEELNTGIDFSAPDPNAIFTANFEEDPAGGDDDELYEEAREIVIQAGKASTSFLQRKLRIGYARAARLIDILEERGVIGPGSGAKPREVIGAETGMPSEEI